MGSSPVDKGTQKTSGAAAGAGAGTLAGYGSGNQQTGTNLQQQLFGNGTPGSTGTLTGMMNPSSLNVTGPTGAYATQYTNAANQNAQQTNQALASTNRALANRGMGGQPSGAGAALTEQAYQGQANTNANNYANYGMQSYQNALSNFWNANNLASSNASTDLGLANSEQQGANSTNTSLYGTASQQKQSPWSTVLGGVAGLGGAALGSGGIAGTIKAMQGCWIAEAIYGVDDARTHIARAWLNGPFLETPVGRAVMRAYLAVGRQVAWLVKRSSILRWALKPLFDCAVDCGVRDFGIAEQ